MDIKEFNDKIAEAKILTEAKTIEEKEKRELAELIAFEKFSEELAHKSSVGNFKDFITNKMIELFAKSDTISLDTISIECDKLPSRGYNSSVKVQSKSLFKKEIYKNEWVDVGYPKITIGTLSTEILNGFAAWAKTALSVEIKIDDYFPKFNFGLPRSMANCSSIANINIIASRI